MSITPACFINCHLVRQPPVDELFIDSLGAEVQKHGMEIDYPVSLKELFHNLVHVILTFMDAFRLLAFKSYPHYAYFASRTRLYMVVMQIQHIDFSTAFLRHHEHFFCQDLRVARFFFRQ